MSDRSGNTAAAYAAILWRRRLPMAVVLAVGFAVTFQMLERKQYEATATVMQVGDQTASRLSASSDLATLLVSSSVAGEVRRNLKIPEGAEAFVRAIDAKTVPGSSVLAITYQNEDRARAVETANALADRMSAYYRELAFGRLDSLDDYLKKKLAAQEGEIADVDRQLAESVAANPGAVGKDVINAAAARILDLQTQRDQLVVKVRGDAARVVEDSRHLAALSGTVHYELEQADPEFRELRLHVANDAATALPIIAGYRPDYAGVKSMQDQLAREHDMVESRRSALVNAPAGASLTFRELDSAASEARASRDSDAARLAALDEQIANARDAMKALPGLNYAAGTLETRRNADITAYEALATKRSNVTADLAETASVGSVVVVDRAVTADATLIGGHLVRVVGGLVSVVVLAIGLAILLESLDTRLRDGAAIERMYGRPYLGGVS